MTRILSEGVISFVPFGIAFTTKSGFRVSLSKTFPEIDPSPLAKASRWTPAKIIPAILKQVYRFKILSLYNSILYIRTKSVPKWQLVYKSYINNMIDDTTIQTKLRLFFIMKFGVSIWNDTNILAYFRSWLSYCS